MIQQSEDVIAVNSEDYKSNIKLIAFLIAFIVLLLTVIFFIKTYADIKQRVIHNMHIEADRLEKLFSEDLAHTTYILEMLAKQIKPHHKDYEHIYRILNAYSTNLNINNMFGWTAFSWTDANHIMRVNSQEGIINRPIDYIYSSNFISEISPNKIHYGTPIRGSISNKEVIPATIGVTNNRGEYIGSITVGFDIATLTQRLNERKRNEYTNFAIIDKRLRVIIKSQSIISKIGVKDEYIVSHNLTGMLKKINFFSNNSKEFSYLDMISGLNYYVKKLDKYPFILLISIADDEISKNIFSKVLTKFLEISIFSSFFLCLIISIYKRETWLRTQAEKASQIAIKATQSKTDFLAFTAHEIRSPLGFVLTGSEIMQKELLGPIPVSYKDYVNGINLNANLILDFINDILDESHIAEGHFKIENSINDIESIIEKAIVTNKTRFNDRKIDIITEINSNIPKLICDGRRILQAINNILSNSIKYSKDYTTITISAKIVNEKMYISITDQGIGMSGEEIKIAFTKYGTVRKKNFSFIQSYGLGLPIVKKLIEAHDAELQVSSKVNEGTVVTIIFPKYKLIYNKIKFLGKSAGELK
jgi:signal transduction histidine kinase